MRNVRPGVPPGGAVKNPLEETVLQEVKRRGRVTFAEFMEWALYHPHHGYYTRGGRTGRSGDFFTNVHTGMVFGDLLAESFVEMWDTLGSGRFNLVELGGADGALAEQILRSFERRGRLDGLSYVLIERSAACREAARRRLSRFPRLSFVDSLGSFEHVSGVEGCIFSNEFFDALPFHRVAGREGRLCELFVEESGGRLREIAGEPSMPELARILREQGVALADGRSAEVCVALQEAVSEIDRILGRGFVLTVDYGEPSAELYGGPRPAGAMQVYRGHELRESPFEEIGESDITTLVDFGRLVELGRRCDLQPLVFAEQGVFLLNSAPERLKELVERESKQDPSILSQVQQLLHPRSLGGAFQVLVQGKNVGAPELKGGKTNRLNRLSAATPKDG